MDCVFVRTVRLAKRSTQRVKCFMRKNLVDNLLGELGFNEKESTSRNLAFESFAWDEEQVV